MNNRISFTQAAMYHLAALNTLLRKLNGTIYRLRDGEEIERLLVDARNSKDPRVIRELAILRSRLWEEEAEKLDSIFRA